MCHCSRPKLPRDRSSFVRDLALGTSSLDCLFILLPERGPGSERVCLGLAGSVWVLDFVQGRFHNMDPGNFEGLFIKAGTVKQGRLSIEEATGESLGEAALAHWEVREKGALETGSGVSRDELPLPIALLVANLLGSLQFMR